MIDNCDRQSYANKIQLLNTIENLFPPPLERIGLRWTRYKFDKFVEPKSWLAIGLSSRRFERRGRDNGTASR